MEILITGAVICAALYLFIWKFMGYSPLKEIKAIARIFKAIGYLFVLLWEIFKANIQVIYLIYNAKLEVEPRIVHFKKKFKEKGHSVALANSITLTPGTITVSLDENDEYTVHCLDKAMGDGLNNSVFVKLLDKMEGGK